MVEMVEILDGRLGQRSVEQVRYVINNALGHCEIWRHFTRTLYFHLPAAHDNTVATREISRHYSTLTHIISHIFTSHAQVTRGYMNNCCVHVYCKSHNVSGPFILARLAGRPFSLR